jgi:hypothetical protein
MNQNKTTTAASLKRGDKVEDTLKKAEFADDERRYLIKDGKQQMPLYDFIKGMFPDAPINQTHNFDLLKAHRLNQYSDAEAKFIEERNIDRVETGDLEKNVFYHGWLRHEIKVIEQWLSDTYPSGEKKKILPSASRQIEILKYKQFVDDEIQRIEILINGNSAPQQNIPIKSDQSEKSPADQINSVVGEIIKNHIIDEASRDNLISTFTSGRSNGLIQIKSKKFTAFFDVFYPLWKADIISKNHYKSEYDFIRNNFQMNGKDISKSTISGAKNRSNWT